MDRQWPHHILFLTGQEIYLRGVLSGLSDIAALLERHVSKEHDLWQMRSSDRPPRVLMPAVAMLAGIVTLLGAPLWVPSRARAPGENPRLGLVDGGV
jgi:hypothetical protein